MHGTAFESAFRRKAYTNSSLSKKLAYNLILDKLRSDEFQREIKRQCPGISGQQIWSLVKTVACDMLGESLDGRSDVISGNRSSTISAIQPLSGDRGIDSRYSRSLTYGSPSSPTFDWTPADVIPSKRTPEIMRATHNAIAMQSFRVRNRIVGGLTMNELRAIKGENEFENRLITLLLAHVANAEGDARVSDIMKDEHLCDYIDRARGGIDDE